MDDRYVAAIETALGAAMQNIIVDNEETAKRCIRFLKETNAGRATMLPMTAMKGRYLNEPRLQSEQGFEGIASDLVECDGDYQNIIRYLLGLTAIVDDIDTAAFLSKKYGAKFRIVTLDGQVVNIKNDLTATAQVEDYDMYKALDAAALKAETQVRKYLEKRKNHKNGETLVQLEAKNAARAEI